jgi:hypothetical protein
MSSLDLKSLSREDVLALMAGSTQQDERLYVVFDKHPVQNEARSIEEGRPIFEDVEYIRIAVPGDPGNVVHRAVKWCGSRGQCGYPRGKDQCDLHRFPRLYFAFKGDLDQAGANGTPLASWPIMTKSMIEELKYLRIHTVEQLAGMADAHAGKLGPGYSQLRNQARTFLEVAKGNAPTVQLHAELEKRDSTIAALEKALAQQGDQLQKLLARAMRDDAASHAAPAPAHAPRSAPAPVALPVATAVEADPAPAEPAPAAPSRRSR